MKSHVAPEERRRWPVVGEMVVRWAEGVKEPWGERRGCGMVWEIR